MSSSSVEEITDQSNDLFTQDGVLLKACSGRPVNELNSIGMLCIVQNSDGTKSIEWRPSDIITVCAVQEQDWALVNAIGRRQRTFSGNLTADYATARARIIRMPLNELKIFRVTNRNQQMSFSNKVGVWQSTFFFQHGNAEVFIAYLKSHVKTAKSSRDRNTYLVVEPTDETRALNRSFTELDIFQENTTDVVWNIVSNLKERPYETTMEAFSKLSSIGLDYNSGSQLLYYGNEASSKRDVSEEVADLLTKSMVAAEEAHSVTKSDEYEVISMKPTLPPRPSIPRSTPLSQEKWEGLQDTLGRVTEMDGVKQLIFRGGVAHSIRKQVWKYLLDYYPWHMTHAELKALQKKRTDEYYCMKLQWRSMTEGQESRFTEYRDRKSLVEKDVNRTDRTHPFFAGDNNPNLETLQDILMTYVMYNFDLGYVQGMSDILAPLLLLMGNEVDTFWCFVGFMERIASNFDMDQAGMKHQLLQLQQLVMFASPELAQHLALKDSGNMYFCFRWLLVWFKREFSLIDIMRLWEVLWTGLPCANFHLLICVAILEAEKEVLISGDYGFTEILKHVNELSMRIEVNKVLSSAEGIYHQIISAPHLTDQIRIILGLTPLGTSAPTEDDDAPEATGTNCKDNDAAANAVLEYDGIEISIVTQTVWALLA
ncbi:TBC1 domain family member 15 isoform X3 [Galleria mellonella]|uniref:TBC1 domain family member 15 n=1 Tax=Galleria mellonella TaxID=7137 RepID=A0A6J3CBP8_GALME|nr:TBC1 domain family member 15 isoform X3 [Galleria mellonella]